MNVTDAVSVDHLGSRLQLCCKFSAVEIVTDLQSIKMYFREEPYWIYGFVVSLCTHLDLTLTGHGSWLHAVHCVLAQIARVVV